MSMNLNFAESENYVAGNYLKPWGIYKVKVADCELKSFQGKQDTTKTYDTIQLTFADEDGAKYIETIFKPNSDKRGETTDSTGHVRQQPSSLENFRFEIAQLLSNICPKAMEKLITAKSLSIESVMKFVTESLKQSVGTEVYIKLIGDSKGRARFPYFLNIDNNGKPFVKNFISTKDGVLGFSAYEEDKRKKVAEAKPTKMASTSNTEGSEDQGALDLDLSSLV